jgi:hypothetical protein
MENMAGHIAMVIKFLIPASRSRAAAFAKKASHHSLNSLHTQPHWELLLLTHLNSQLIGKKTYSYLSMAHGIEAQKQATK